MAPSHMDKASWECTPLGDRNGRAKINLSKPIQANTVTVSEGEAEAIRRKLVDVKNRATAAEEKVASQEKTIQQLSSALAKVQNKKGVSGYVPEEKTLELAAMHLQLSQARQELECKDSELDRILPEVAVTRLHDSQRLQNKEAEIDRLCRELGSSNAEIAHLRPELYQAQQLVEHKNAELERLLPEIVNLRMHASQRHHNKDAEIDQVRQELDSARAELAVRNTELQQAKRDLELKDSELHHLRTEMLASSKQSAERRQSTGGAMGQLRQELESSHAELAKLRPELRTAQQRLEHKEAEVDRLLTEVVSTRIQGSRRHSLAQAVCKDSEIDNVHNEFDNYRLERSQQQQADARLAEAELAEARLAEAERLRTEALKADTAVAEHDDNFEQARLVMEQRLSERKIQLAMREQALAAAEAWRKHGSVESGMPNMQRYAPTGGGPRPNPSFHGRSGAPSTTPGQGLWERLGFAGR